MKLYYLKYAKLIILNTLIIVFLLSLTILLNSSGDFAPAPVITYSTQNPEEKHPSEAGYKWSGQKDDPKYIVIPKIKVDTFVQNVGIDQNQQITIFKIEGNKITMNGVKEDLIGISKQTGEKKIMKPNKNRIYV